MKPYFFILIVLTAGITSCSSVYKSSQTPDDVYYSPVRPLADEEKTDERYSSAPNANEDRYLRMKARNYTLWSSLDNYSYWNDCRFQLYTNYYQYPTYQYYNPWSYWGYSFYQPAYWGWNGWYYPAYAVVAYKNPKLNSGSTNAYNMLAYGNQNYQNTNAYTLTKAKSSNSFGNTLSRAFNNGNTTTVNPTRTFNSSSTPSSNAGGRSGGFNSSGSSTSKPRSPR